MVNINFCDLHTHSVFSDGTLTPTELIDEALSKNLAAIALCDHNTVDGLPEFLSAAKEKDITAVPGAEFSVDYNGTELHLLGLFLPEDSFEKIGTMMQVMLDRKKQSNMDLIAALSKAGYDIDYETIRSRTPNGNFNRAHVAAYLTEEGYTTSRKYAFQTLLSKKGGYYKEPQRYTLWEMLDFLSVIGAVPVLAHPFLNLNETQLTELLPKAHEKGLIGMECYYSEYDAETTQKALDLADKFHLLYSGGSDFHGGNKPHIQLGTGMGNLQIPCAWMTQLQKHTCHA